MHPELDLGIPNQDLKSAEEVEKDEEVVLDMLCLALCVWASYWNFEMALKMLRTAISILIESDGASIVSRMK